MDDWDFCQDEATEENGAQGKSGLLSSFLRGLSVNIVGSESLSKEDIQTALDGMKRKLMERNVAEEIAAK